MRAVWTQPKPSYRRPYVSFDGVQAMPRPVQAPVPIVVGGRTPPAFRRAVTQGHGWYGFGLDVAETQKFVAALRETEKKHPRPPALGTLEISVTPPGFDVPDKATVDAYAAAGVAPADPEASPGDGCAGAGALRRGRRARPGSQSGLTGEGSAPDLRKGRDAARLPAQAHAVVAFGRGPGRRQSAPGCPASSPHARRWMPSPVT